MRLAGQIKHIKQTNRTDFHLKNLRDGRLINIKTVPLGEMQSCKLIWIGFGKALDCSGFHDDRKLL